MRWVVSVVQRLELERTRAIWETILQSSSTTKAFKASSEVYSSIMKCKNGSNDVEGFKARLRGQNGGAMPEA
jgi:hypothetical protein